MEIAKDGRETNIERKRKEGKKEKNGGKGEEKTQGYNREEIRK